MIREFYNYYFAKDKYLAQKLKEVLGFVPKNLNLFKKAFYHKSMNDELTHSNQHNERLEYLGDSVLSVIVAEYLFNKYPNQDEGFLTKMRSKIVKRNTLNQLAGDMGLDIILSNYMQGSMSRSMLGNAFEAVIGAIYLEKGFSYTRSYVVKQILLKHLNIHELESTDDNYKSQLLEWGQKNNIEVDYKLLMKYKLDKRDRFKIGVFINGQSYSEGDDYNKKAAEQTASEIALQKLSQHDTEFSS